jgi:hypothetical protein
MRLPCPQSGRLHEKPLAFKDLFRPRLRESVSCCAVSTFCARNRRWKKIAVLFYNAMRFGMQYVDPRADHYEQRYKERVIKQLHRRAAEFGFCLQPTDGVS